MLKLAHSCLCKSSLLFVIIHTFFTRCISRCLVCIVAVVLRALLSSYLYLLYYVCIAVFILDAGLLARSQYSEGPATGHLDRFFLVFPVSISKC